MGNGASSSSSSSSDEEDVSITEAEFRRAIKACGDYPTPSHALYNYFSRETRSFSRAELAMFLAQCIHESGGFRHREEEDPAGPYDDGGGFRGRSYHGRGYIQLTWTSNYRRASRALGLGDQLLRRPDDVAEDVELAVQVSTWYWKRFVRPELRRRPNCFGVTTNAINGSIECDGDRCDLARSRYKKYRRVARVLSIENLASERGCYN